MSLRHGPGGVTACRVPPPPHCCFWRTEGSESWNMASARASSLTPPDQGLPAPGGLSAGPTGHGQEAQVVAPPALSYSGQGPMCGPGRCYSVVGGDGRDLDGAPQLEVGGPVTAAGGVQRTASCRNLPGRGQALVENVCTAGHSGGPSVLAARSRKTALATASFREASPKVRSVSQTGDTVFRPGHPRLLGPVLRRSGKSEHRCCAVRRPPLPWLAA